MKTELTSISASGDDESPLSDNEAFLELRPAKSLSLIKIHESRGNPKTRTQNLRRQKTKIQIVAALSVLTLLVAVSIILYFAITHYTTTNNQSGSTESGTQPTNLTTTTSLQHEVTESTRPNLTPDSTNRYETDSTTTTEGTSSSVTGVNNVTTTESVPAEKTSTHTRITTEKSEIATTHQTGTSSSVTGVSDVTTTESVPADKTSTHTTTTTEKSEIATTHQTVPVKYVRERMTFQEAMERCEKMGTQLAFKEDLQKAYEAGYERCAYGWLGDTHEGFVMQRSNPRCGRGRTGVIYSHSPLNINSVRQGVYCKTSPEKSDDNPPIIRQTQKSVNWWVRIDPVDIYNLKNMLSFSWQTPVTKKPPSDDAASPSNLLGSLRAVYPCCNFLNISWVNDGKENRTFVRLKSSMANMKYLADEYRRQFTNLSVLPHVYASYEAMMLHGAATTNRTEIIGDLVEKAAAAGVDGLIMDYEPATEYTREHAIVYRDFVNELTKKMREENMEVGMMISGWGILKFYDVYSTVNCRMVGSMASTYSGEDVQRNIKNVDEMLLHIATQRLQIGIGSMHDDEEVKVRPDFGWEPDELNEFFGHMEKVGIEHLHIYPGHWGAIQWTEDFFMNSLLGFASA